jgi:hypothetical protein
LEKATGVSTEETPDNQHEEKAVNHELVQFAEAYDDVKGHPCTSKPTSPIVSAQQKNTANDCERFSDLDPDPVGRATVTKVNNKTADTHGQIKTGDQDYSERYPVTARSFAHSFGSVLVHRNPQAPRFALSGILPLSKPAVTNVSQGSSWRSPNFPDTELMFLSRLQLLISSRTYVV